MLTGSVKKHVKQAIPAYVILAAIVVLIAIVSPSFRKVGNIRNIIAQCAVLAIVAIAQSNVLFIGGIDMSVSSVISFSTIMVAMFSADSALGLAGSVILALAVGALTGLVNGIGVVKFRIPAMIITISTQAFLKGICLILMPTSGGKVNTAFAAFLKTRLGVINVSAILALMLFAAFFVVYHYTRFGRSIYAIGNGEVYAAPVRHRGRAHHCGHVYDLGHGGRAGGRGAQRAHRHRQPAGGRQLCHGFRCRGCGGRHLHEWRHRLCRGCSWPAP